MNRKSGTIQTDITGTNKPISLAQFDPIYPLNSEMIIKLTNISRFYQIFLFWFSVSLLNSAIL
ncbi:MAG: hypothetical protein CVU08_15705, partial [Bacteroidetes bacterium HGW-Bacteroidetes-3]